MNFWDVLILLAVAGAAILAFLRARKRKAAGKSCCGNCGSCGLCRKSPDRPDN